ncbi:MAG: hypothetical protein QF718_00310 [Phycisphaerales bacterium]|jgi:hypothetical protein|nr:hypothetical protein [Phycisphaerales bacterium]
MKRYISLLVILGVAGFISWWSSKNEAGVTHHIQDEVTKLVPLFAEDPSSINAFVVDPILQPILVSSLQLAINESKHQHQDIVVVVTGGDNASYGDGTATHVATLNINHHSVVGLRIVCSSKTDPILIAGVFSNKTDRIDTP